MNSNFNHCFSIYYLSKLNEGHATKKNSSFLLKTIRYKRSIDNQTRKIEAAYDSIYIPRR